MSHGHSINISYIMGDMVLTVTGADGEPNQGESLYPVLTHSSADALFRPFIGECTSLRDRMRVGINSKVTATQIPQIAESIADTFTKSGYAVKLDESFDHALEYENAWRRRLGSTRAHYERTKEPAARDEKGWGTPKSAVLSEFMGDIMITITNSNGEPGEGSFLRPYLDSLKGRPGLEEEGPGEEMFHVNRDAILAKVNEGYRCCDGLGCVAATIASVLEFAGLDVTTDPSFTRQIDYDAKWERFSLDFERFLLDKPVSG